MHTEGKLLDGTECQILLDTGSSKLFMSKSHYLWCKTLYSLPKFESNTWPQILNLYIVSQIHENVDLVFGIKNIFELEGIINSQESCFSFLNRLIPFFTKEQTILKPKEQRFIKIEAPFVDEISGLAIIKMLDRKAQNTMILCRFLILLVKS